MPTIKTKYGNYYYKALHFEVGGKILNKQISKENLLLFKEVMDKNNIKFILAYGTLLGAIRENDFIDYDEDIDVIILEEDRERFLDLLFEFKKKGLTVGRYANDLLSLIRQGDYIDIYIFKKYRFGLRSMAGSITKEKFLINTTKYKLFGKDFDIPKDYIKYLEYYYGKDWEVPRKNVHAYKVSLLTKIKKLIITKTPFIYKLLKIFVAKKN